jgi:hypothetical protein
VTLRSILMNTTVCWDLASCSLVEIDRRLRGAYCLRHEGDLHIRCRENPKSHYFNAIFSFYPCVSQILQARSEKLPEMDSRGTRCLRYTLSRKHHFTSLRYKGTKSDINDSTSSVSVLLSMLLSVTITAVFITHELHAQTHNTWVT